MQSWYLLYTKPHGDELSEMFLMQQGHDVFRPKLRFYKQRNGLQTVVTESLFPRYLFIRLDDEICNWASVRSTRGVKKFVQFGDMPAKLSDDIVDGIKELVDKNNVIDKTLTKKSIYEYGDLVEIVDGSFKGHRALVESQDSEQRVILLLTILGGQKSVSVPIRHVRLGGEIRMNVGR